MRGGCLCGEVQFELDPPLRDVLICHCSLCRRSGTLAGAYTAVESDHLRLQVDSGLAWYTDVNGRERGFCRTCGATLFWRSGTATISVSAGALDDQAGLRTRAHIFADSAAAWESLPGDAPHRSG
jgi:hypothetical protein